MITVICPECGTRLPRSQTQCHFCGYTINLAQHNNLTDIVSINPEPDPSTQPITLVIGLSVNSDADPNQNLYHSNFQESINFFDKNANLFTIIVAICTIISLAPLFLTFLYGEQWFNELIGSSLGFNCLTYAVIASIFGVAFVYYLLWLILIDFINKFFRRNANFLDFVYSGIILILAIITIGYVGVFLIEVWYTKFNSLISLTAINWLIFVILSGLVLLVGVLLHFGINTSNYAMKGSFYVAGLVIVLFVIGLIVIPTYQSLNIISNETSKYYSDKSAAVEIGYSIGNLSNDLPKIIALKANISGFNESNTVSSIDRFYAQCRWSTNYGYFTRISSNGSVISKYSYDLIVPNCVENRDKVYWSYDMANVGKYKPDVLIGLNFEDPYKKVKNHLGESHLIFNWTKADELELENNSSIIQFPF